MTKEIVLPEGWEVDKIENGKIVLKEVKSPYPNTWGECFIQMKGGEYISALSSVRPLSILSSRFAYKEQHNTLPVGYGRKVLALCQLLVCRNAYWGDWRPNWEDACLKYTIRIYKGTANPDDGRFYQRILVFPTREMRDAFYKNFKDLIEEAKDLL